MKVKILKSGRRLVGFGTLPEVGAQLEIPDDLAEQLISQKVAEPIRPTLNTATASDDDAATDEEIE